MRLELPQAHSTETSTETRPDRYTASQCDNHDTTDWGLKEVWERGKEPLYIEWSHDTTQESPADSIEGLRGQMTKISEVYHLYKHAVLVLHPRLLKVSMQEASEVMISLKIVKDSYYGRLEYLSGLKHDMEDDDITVYAPTNLEI